LYDPTGPIAGKQDAIGSSTSCAAKYVTGIGFRVGQLRFPDELKSSATMIHSSVIRGNAPVGAITSAGVAYPASAWRPAQWLKGIAFATLRVPVAALNTSLDEPALDVHNLREILPDEIEVGELPLFRGHNLLTIPDRSK